MALRMQQTASQALLIDINSEMAEGFDLPPCGIDLATLESIALPGSGARFHARHGMARFDHEVMPYVSSVSLACGAHSGDPLVLQRTIPTLVMRGIKIGAHPSYPDIFRFGQHRIDMDPSQLEAVILFQLGALGAVLKAHGERIQHVKCHGALQTDVSYDPTVTKAMVRAIRAYDSEIVLVLMAGSPCVAVARDLGVTVAEEAFLDRGYGVDGRIVARNHPAALLKDPHEAATRTVRMVLAGEGTSVDGVHFALRADTYCIHSDTPNVSALITAIDRALRESGVQRRPLKEVLSQRKS